MHPLSFGMDHGLPAALTGAFARVLLLAASLLSATGCTAGTPVPAVLPDWTPGVQSGTVEIDGDDEGFVALVPTGYSTQKQWPTVLLLHGNGATAGKFLEYVRQALGDQELPLLISLERCDNRQQAVGYCPKYLVELKKRFSIDEANAFALGTSGGGFRLWDDVVCNADESPAFRGVILFASARQRHDPPEKPEPAPTVILVGDPRDPNFTERAPAAERALTAGGYEVFVLEHLRGHSTPPKELREVFAWIGAVATGKEHALATRRIRAGEEPNTKR